MTINHDCLHPREKCLDCHNYKFSKGAGQFVCAFGLEPVSIAGLIECNGYKDATGTSARNALQRILKRD